MVEQFHPDKNGEPGGDGALEELVAVGDDIIFSQAQRQVRAPGGGLQGDGINQENNWDVDEEEDQIQIIACAEHGGGAWVGT